MKKKEYVVVNYTVTFAAPFKFCGVHYLKGIPYCFTAHIETDIYGTIGMTPRSLAEFDYGERFCSCSAQVEKITPGKAKIYEA